MLQKSPARRLEYATMTVNQIEPVLQRNLLKLRSQYATLKGLSGVRVQHATGGATFFATCGRARFRLRRVNHDLIVGYFRANWPERRNSPSWREPMGHFVLPNGDRRSKQPCTNGSPILPSSDDLAIPHGHGARQVERSGVPVACW